MIIDDFDLYLFDFDGLLINTERLHYQAYVNMLAARGYALDWNFPTFCSIAHLSNEGLKNEIYATFPRLFEQEPNWAVLYEEKKRAYISLIETSNVELMEGVSSFLELLFSKKKICCVVTNSTREQTKILASSHPLLQKIPYWITREDYEKSKPAPDSYLQAITLYGRDKKIIGFEDSYRGLAALCQTPAIPVLICSKDHPQLDGVLPCEAMHFTSFTEMVEQIGFCKK